MMPEANSMGHSLPCRSNCGRETAEGANYSSNCEPLISSSVQLTTTTQSPRRNEHYESPVLLALGILCLIAGSLLYSRMESSCGMFERNGPLLLCLTPMRNISIAMLLIGAGLVVWSSLTWSRIQPLSAP